ncbi:HAD family hydrolase [Rhizobium sp. SSA_523]|uniref:HAD family hydrolase n=2 Tax=Rhizobium sp. SSA_523 TaxID=2952477 RepID=UPI00339D5F60
MLPVSATKSASNSASGPLVVFDLDGTMIDTAPDLIESLNDTIALRDLAPVTFDDLTHLVGQGARVMIRRAFNLRDVPVDDADVERLLSHFLDHYLAHMPGKSQAYEGLLDCFDRLEAAGMRLAVCTNKLEQLALPLLERLRLTQRFAAITGGDTFPVRKPDARHLLGTIERAGGDPLRSILVGDSVNDIMAAKNAGVGSVGVTFGYSDVPMAELAPTRIIGHFSELTPDLVADVMAKAVA